MVFLFNIKGLSTSYCSLVDYLLAVYSVDLTLNPLGGSRIHFTLIGVIAFHSCIIDKTGLLATILLQKIPTSLPGWRFHLLNRVVHINSVL